MKNFFRHDLNLDQRRWHRLLKVSLLIILCLALLDAFVSQLDRTRYVKNELLVSRMGSDLKNLNDLVGDNERLGRSEGAVLSNLYYKNEGYLLNKPNVYCSTNIIAHVETISRITNVPHFKGDKDLISLGEFKSYLGDQDALCVSVVHFLGSTSEYYGVESALSWEVFISDDYYIWTTSYIPSIKTLVLSFIGILLAFLMLLVVYYKLVLYVIFGSSPRGNTS